VAQVNLANAKAQEVRAKCDYLIARSAMDRAVGRLSHWARAE
jgi:outer membrane protein TolC